MKKKPSILIVDDEEDIVELVAYNLQREGFDTLSAYDGSSGIRLALNSKPDLLLLDLMLPDQSGFDVCRSLREDRRSQELPIIMVTAKGEESDVVTGLELGADDYITKPFSPSILLARVRSVLRRSERRKRSQSEIIQVDQLRIDRKRHEVYCDEKLLELTSTEFKILFFLATHRGWVFTRDQIIDEVHGTDYPVTPRSIDVQITGLRKKLANFGDLIETIRGVGYRFKDDS